MLLAEKRMNTTPLGRLTRHFFDDINE